MSTDLYVGFKKVPDGLGELLATMQFEEQPRTYGSFFTNSRTADWPIEISYSPEASQTRWRTIDPTVVADAMISKYSRDDSTLFAEIIQKFSDKYELVVFDPQKREL